MSYHFHKLIILDRLRGLIDALDIGVALDLEVEKEGNSPISIPSTRGMLARNPTSKRALQRGALCIPA